MGSDVIFEGELLVGISWDSYLVTGVRITPNIILEVAEIGKYTLIITPLKSSGYCIYHQV
jgi:hypothetical protein